MSSNNKVPVVYVNLDDKFRKLGYSIIERVNKEMLSTINHSSKIIDPDEYLNTTISTLRDELKKSNIPKYDNVAIIYDLRRYISMIYEEDVEFTNFRIVSRSYKNHMESYEDLRFNAKGKHYDYELCQPDLLDSYHIGFSIIKSTPSGERRIIDDIKILA